MGDRETVGRANGKEREFDEVAERDGAGKSRGACARRNRNRGAAGAGLAMAGRGGALAAMVRQLLDLELSRRAARVGFGRGAQLPMASLRRARGLRAPRARAASGTP